ncbi:uncharacterized protein CANTADRAFT_88551 [Suhomyces tanzawaensis NRRL Y-17324]|uniref:SUN domain-containing protein n=1 Tax=Suhomyces tanzawaensis NRRL Y-17324 TaxID=984487 RepID=A0A1E4SM82_9ASCO|nr:uncharacterized protein CANTADRAFT_88551 [Suhomyces tanzawaensis NRRL Y-17324]ODV80621.1 hypothetical protein CANTADRAFT_88551 [Suhomyces tanzawaensis NRRL Y-17324]
MAGFPRLPLVHGDTDDDASIHLHRQIGPSRPLRRLVPTDEKILEIAHDESVDDLDTNNINHYYELYRKNGLNFLELDESSDDSYSPDSGSDTYNESDDEDGYDHDASDGEERIHEDEKERFRLGVPEEPQQQPAEEHTTDEPPTHNKGSSDTLLGQDWRGITLLVFILAYLISLLRQSAVSQPLGPAWTSRLNKVDRALDQLSDITSGLSTRQDFLDANHESLAKNLNTRFESLNQKFHAVEKSLLGDNQQFQHLAHEFETLKTSINSTVNHDRLDAINAKLAVFDGLSSTVESLQAHLLDQLVASLPQHVPVYIKDRKIHFLPEFHKYLYNFVDTYTSNKTGHSPSSNPSWALFLESNQASLDAYIETRAGGLNLQQISKDKLEQILRQKFEQNNKYIFGKINEVIDDLTAVDHAHNTTTGARFSSASNTILLNNLLETFAKGAIKVNYADYGLGARILGFLTKSGARAPTSSKSLGRRIFFGWYDYLSGASGGLVGRSPGVWKYNANNVLLDNGQGWQCESNRCTLGVRMFSPVILTDIVLANPVNAEGDSVSAPRVVAVWVKPRNAAHATQLREHLQRYQLDADTTNNRYLEKFVKVKETRVNHPQAITHIRMPVSMVNLRIPVRDIYLELLSPINTETGLTSFKAYGITELNAYRHSTHFDALLDKLQTQPEDEEAAAAAHPQIVIDDSWDDLVLGDDPVL